ncbi:hypothetical protein LCGC14_1144220 [marine sediment metagenome]|uniref:Uncharacterized protein n=1 Tax=marine sediment metagenome TaxID=412755 RepID=A0A0F9PFK7_9ZZZZ
MNWLRGFFNNIRVTWVGLGESHYNQGYIDGYQEGQEDGHAHGVCKHTHPFQDTFEGTRWTIKKENLR